MCTGPSRHLVITTLILITRAQKNLQVSSLFMIVTIRTSCTCSIKTKQAQLGASTIQWTTLDPYKGLNESD